MRLYGAIQKVEPQDDGTVRVYGIATSEALDEQGEIVRADAIRAAIPNYMRFPALREMHPSPPPERRSKPRFVKTAPPALSPMSSTRSR